MEVYMKNVIHLALFASLTFSTLLFAEENLLCRVESDMNNDYALMNYEMDLDGRGILHLFSDSYSNNQKTDRMELKLDDLLGDGIVLMEKNNMQIIKMYSHNFDLERGGIIYMDTLYNGINGKRKSYELNIKMEPINGIMGPVIYKDNVPFKRMRFIANRHRVWGIIGIDHIDFSK